MGGARSPSGQPPTATSAAPTSTCRGSASAGLRRSRRRLAPRPTRAEASFLQWARRACSPPPLSPPPGQGGFDGVGLGRGRDCVVEERGGKAAPSPLMILSPPRIRTHWRRVSLRAGRPTGLLREGQGVGGSSVRLGDRPQRVSL